MKKEDLTRKYKKFVENMEWHIKTNEPRGADLTTVENNLAEYREFLNDLNALDESPATPQQGITDDEILMIFKETSQVKDLDISLMIEPFKSDIINFYRSLQFKGYSREQMEAWVEQLHSDGLINSSDQTDLLEHFETYINSLTNKQQ